jgi:hypothetical protein
MQVLNNRYLEVWPQLVERIKKYQFLQNYLHLKTAGKSYQIYLKKNMYDPADLLTKAWPFSRVAGFVAEPRRQTTLSHIVAYKVAVSLKIDGISRKSLAPG